MNEDEVKTSLIEQLPPDILFKEGASQHDRVLTEVMEALFAQLPKNSEHPCDFILSNGTRCWVKKFSPPKKRADGMLAYGFDVKFSDEAALSHLEFFVKCTGWERNLAPQNKDTVPTSV